MLYQQLMTLFAILFATLLACRVYIVHRTRMRRVLVPIRLAERKTIAETHSETPAVEVAQAAVSLVEPAA